MSPEKPQKIGRYEIKSELGRGGMATVYKAYDPRFEREVALKLLPHEMMHDSNFRLRFEREAKTIAKLEHPAIVPVYDVGEEDGQPYFVMRCMAGGSLADRIAKGPLSIKEAAKILERISAALDEAHSRGVIHRDLKPGNILFDNIGEPYISDFGIAKLTQTQSTTMTGGAIIGTPAYMSPEQAQGDQLIDGRSDVYAIGVIVYEMLSGTQPYQSTTPMGVVVKHITEPIPHILDKNPRLPFAIESVIEKAMAKNRDQRFSTAGELSIALSSVASGQTGEEAIKTASMSSTVVKAKIAKTQLAAQKTQAAKKQPQQKSISPLVYILPAIAVVGIVILAVGAYLMGFIPVSQPPTATVTTAPTIQATPVPPTEIPPTEAPTFTPTLPPPTETVLPTDTPMPTETPKPVIQAVGGVDKVAFVANNEIYLMNINGSGKPAQLTNDGKPKSDLQWMLDGKTLVFLSDKNVNTIEADTGRFDTITSFPYSEYFDAFRISPDGKQVAISLNRQMYIVPFDLAALKQARVQGDLTKMKGCLQYKGLTQAAVQVKEFRWSLGMKLIAWLFPGVGAGATPEDIIRVVDISSCDPNRLSLKDEFPGTRFTPSSYITNPVISDFDWDGTYGFIFNTAIRNNGWGDLYFYNFDLRKGYPLNPVGGRCCYRDARFSPDGTHIFFAFQDFALGDNATTQVYYVPFSINYQGTDYQPIPIPSDLFKNRREAPQPALHAAQP